MAALAAGAGSAAMAEMGRAPVAVGTYVSFEGGYMLLDAERVRGYGYSTAAPVTHLGDVQLDARSGWFGGAALGFAARPGAMLGYFDRAEVSFGYGRSEKSRSAVGDSLALANVAANALSLATGTANATLEREVFDAALALKRTDGAITWSIEPFLRFSSDETQQSLLGAAGLATRSGQAESIFYGLMAAAEPEIALSQSISLAGRLGAGIYGYSATGKFSSQSAATPAFNASLSEDASGVGFRGAFGGAVKVKLSKSVLLSTYATGDYWSRTPSMSMTDQNVLNTDPSHLRKDDLWDLRTGVRLTIGLGK